jgi:succinyl-diaminopimelate desuccinylase
MEALQMLPTGKLLPVGPERDLRQGRTLLELDLDDVYFGMAPGKRAGIQWRGSNIDLTLEASKEFTHLVVFTPWDRPLFAIENQTSSTDAHNLWGKGFKRESNLLVLQPGARAGGFVRWRLARIQPTTPVVPGERPSDPHARYDQSGSPHLAPLLSEVLRYPTVAGNEQARKHQQAWLKRTGEGLKFTVRDAGLVTEIELPASPTAVPAGKPAPVLGLVVHGDVQPVEEAKWKIPPWKGVVQDGKVLGRGAADDKGPLVQALLAMKALRESEVPRTHTVRLLVGSDEESGSKDIASYLKSHKPPDYSLVLDSQFPVVVGEKAWDALYLDTPLAERPGRTKPYEVVELSAGLSPSIVPDEARLGLRWKTGTPQWQALTDALDRRPPGQDISVSVEPAGDRLRVTTRGRAAHGGVNLAGGRNALVALARLVEGLLPSGGADDLLAAARLAGKDLQGGGFGLTERHPLWGRYSVNVATLKPEGPNHRLLINLRRPPPRTAAALEAHLTAWTQKFNARTGAKLAPSGYFKDEPLVFDPKAKLVKKLQEIYTRASGRRDPLAISGGGTYAKRLPNSIAYGMWFPGKPYPGHDVDEQVPLLDLQRGAHVLVETLLDLATAPPLVDPFKP